MLLYYLNSELNIIQMTLPYLMSLFSNAKNSSHIDEKHHKIHAKDSRYKYVQYLITKLKQTHEILLVSTIITRQKKQMQFKNLTTP